MRTLLYGLFNLILRIFFQRVEVAGADRLPKDGPLLFAVNHPNALVDGMFLYCLAPRWVSFMAKAPLFQMWFVGFFVRATYCLPIFRAQDQQDPAKNRETFRRAHEILAAGDAITIFPEGTTHSEPRLKPIKTGAARLALGAGIPLHVVPTGLFYTEKGIFRSKALLYYGEPIAVQPVPSDADGEPPRDEVLELSRRIEDGLRDVTLNAEDSRALHLVALAERIFNSEVEPDGMSMLRGFETRRRFLEGYSRQLKRSMRRMHRLETRILQYEADLHQAGLAAGDLVAGGYTARDVLRRAASKAAGFLMLMPPALVGTILHYPAYRVIGWLATRYSRQDDTVLSTAKIVGAMLFFPLTWALAAGAVFCQWSLAGALAALALAPVTGWAALHFMERVERFRAALRALTCFMRKRGWYEKLVSERRAIRREIQSMAEDLAASPGGEAVEGSAEAS